MKRFCLLCLLTLLALFSCSPVFGGHKFEVDGIWYVVTTTDVDNPTVMATWHGAYVEMASSTTTLDYTTTDIEIPETVTDGDNAHYLDEETGAEPTYITYTVTSIDENFGGGYTSYNSVQFTSVKIPKTVTTIYKEAFRGCDKLTSVTFDDNSQLTTIGEGAFCYCTSLTSVTFGDNSQLTTIGKGAFYLCPLSSIEIPSNVTYIGDGAFFRENPNLYDDDGYSTSTGTQTIICHCTTPPTLDADWWDEIFAFNRNIFEELEGENPNLEEYISNGGRYSPLLIVPEDAGVAYANTDGWKSFYDEWEPYGIDAILEDTVTITPDAQDGEYYYCTHFSPYSYTLQEGEEGAIITVSSISKTDDGGTLNLSWDYVGGEGGKDVVPANTALLIRSRESKSYANPTIAENLYIDWMGYQRGDLYTDEELPKYTTSGLLCGNVKDGVGYWSTYDTETKQTTKKDVTTYVSYDDSASDDYYFYKLTYGADGTANADVLGFYWATHEQTGSEEDGAPFTVNGKHAWLAIPKSTFADGTTMASLPLNKMETTGIKVVDTTETTTDAIYNLQGMRVSDMSQKGLYIVNGKKVIKK